MADLKLAEQQAFLRRQIHLLSTLQNVCSMFPTGKKKDTETVLGKAKKTKDKKQNNIPKNITCLLAHLLEASSDHRTTNAMSGWAHLNQTYQTWCETSGQLERGSREWLMFCSSPFPVAMGDSVAWQLPAAFLRLFWQIWSGPAFSCWSPDTFSGTVFWVPAKLLGIIQR